MYDTKNESLSNLLNIENYIKLVEAFRASDYSFLKFQDNFPSNKPYVIFRHDEDFCLRASLAIARIEYQMGIVSSYFFLLHSPLYNLLSRYACDILAEISSMGHDVCLHFEMNLPYTNNIDKLNKDISIFSEIFPFANANVISFHKVGPKAHKLKDVQLPKNIIHTYDKAFFSNIEYFSDSGGKWRGAVPYHSPEFDLKRSMQVLTHPMWWTQGGNNEFEKIKDFLNTNREETIDFLEKTVISYSLDSVKNLPNNLFLHD